MAKVALLIGVANYDSGLGSLPAAERDALAMAEVLVNPEFSGFLKEDIQVLVNADSSEIRKAIEIVFSDREKADLVVLYFSGHGVKDESGSLYLAARDTQKTSSGQIRTTTTVECSLVHRMMAESRCKQQIVILDCCFSGAFSKGMSARSNHSIDVKSQLLQEAEGRVVLTSSASSQFSFEEQNKSLGVYTRCLLEGITTGFADSNGDGIISIDELHEYAKKKLREEFPKMNPEIYAVRQGYKIAIAKAKVSNPQARYRQEVELHIMPNGRIPNNERIYLNTLREQLCLTKLSGDLIEKEIIEEIFYKQKIRKNRQRWTVAAFSMIFTLGVIFSISLNTFFYPKPKSPFILNNFTSISQFKDVSSKSEYFSSLKNLVEKYRIPTQAYSDGSFRPDYPIRRDEFVDYLMRTWVSMTDLMNALMSDYKGDTCNLPDKNIRKYTFKPPKDISPQIAWYHDSYRDMAEYIGIGNIDSPIFQSNDGMFHPDLSLTRAEMVVSFNRFLDAYLTLIMDATSCKKKTMNRSSNEYLFQNMSLTQTFLLSQLTSISQVRDVNSNDWYFTDLQSLIERYGSIAVDQDKNFRPEKIVSRAEFVMALNTSLDRLSDLIAYATSDLVRKNN